jgi:serine/threonine protein kinase
MKNEENDDKLVANEENEEDKEVDVSSGKLKLITAIIIIAFIISIALVIVGIVKYFFTEPKDYEVYQKYEKMGQITESGDDKVYKGQNKENKNEYVAIKEIHISSNRTKDSIEQEIEYMKLFNNNKNSLKLIETCEEDNIIFLVTELYEDNLKTFVDKSKDGFKPGEIQIVMNQLSSVLKEIVNQDIFHHDIKLENILVKFDNESKFDVKLSEYGKAKNLTNEKNLTIDEEKELCLSDLFSLGELMYEMSFKKRENSTEEMIENINKISDLDLVDSLNKTLVDDVEQRIDWEDFFNHNFIDTTDLDWSQVENIKKLN